MQDPLERIKQYQELDRTHKLFDFEKPTKLPELAIEIFATYRIAEQEKGYERTKLDQKILDVAHTALEKD